jgi:Rad3-related DNA helicase
MKDNTILDDIAKIIKYIVDHHKNDKGLILVPSFYMSKQIVSRLPKTICLFEHKQETNSADAVARFKAHKGAGVLISPSLFEGLDFKDEESRYQIICKTPYASLGDLRVKKIADSYGDIYKEMTLYKILQGIGRSIRSEKDFAVTYFLDKSSQTLFESKLNCWKDRFKVNPS